VRESAPHQQSRNCKKIIKNAKNWSRVPGGCLIPKRTGRQTVGGNITLTLTLTLTLTRPSVWSSGQSSWLQIQRSGFDSDFLRSSGFERSPLSLVSTIERLLGRKSSGSGLGNWEYGRRKVSDDGMIPRHPSIRNKLALTSPTRGGRSVGSGHVLCCSEWGKKYHKDFDAGVVPTWY
jgi:hypothetical protein